MKIRLEPQVAIALEACAVQVHGQEFSGFGMVRVDREHQEFVIYDVIPLDVGTTVYTEIVPEKILKLIADGKTQDMHCWFHRHPVGNGVPGPHNWSGTDNATIAESPLGGIPELVGWSISIVRTPDGWVGRVDNHKTHKTQHLEVIGQASPELIHEINRIYHAYMARSAVRPFPVVTGSLWEGYEVQVIDPKLQPSLFDGLEEEEEEESMTSEIATTDLTQEMDQVESKIEEASSMLDFENVEKRLLSIEDEMFDTLGRPPAPMVQRLAALNRRYEERERQALLIEEDE